MNTNTNQALYTELWKDGKIFTTNMKPPYGNNVHNDYTSNRYYEPSNRSFNIFYLKSPEFIKDIKKNPLFLGSIPADIFNENDIWDLINTNPISIIGIDESYIQPNMYATAVMLEPRLLGLLNDRFQTIDVVSSVVKKQPMALEHVRDDLKYFYVCQAAVSLDWRAIKFVPSDIIDSKLLEIVQKNEDAFLLDKIDRSKLDSNFYIDQLVQFPIEGATHVIAANLVNNVSQINDLIHLIENLDAYAPEFIFDNCDPKILMHHEKHDALAYLFSQRPQWIQYLKPHFVTDEIFKIALENDVFPKLESLSWSGEMIALAFSTNKKAYINLPLDRLKSVGITRITKTIEEAIQEGWVNQLPKYFFTDEVVNNQDLRQILIGHRAPFAYLMTQNHKLDWERLINLECSVAEYRLLNQSIPTELADQFFEKYIESYIALADEDKTLERTIKFLKIYPNEVRVIPKKIKDNSEVLNQIIKDNPMIGRYLELDEIINLI